MTEIHEKAYAKLNISLDVLGTLPNGYHEMSMVMQTVSLHDDVLLRPNSSGEISLRTNLGFLPCDEGNIAYRAAALFYERAGIPCPGLELELHKRIPVCAGMGGGSSDGAAVLRGLNKLHGDIFSRAQLEEMAAGIGSDIPFCVAGGTQLATGTGTTLRDISPLPDCGIVICKPAFSIRTPELFKKIDSRRSRLHPDTAGILASLENGDIPGISRRMYNVFEDVLPRGCGEIYRLKGLLLDCGALGAVMSGTGSALFGIFADMAAAEKACAALKPQCRNVYPAQPVGKLI